MKTKEYTGSYLVFVTRYSDPRGYTIRRVAEMRNLISLMCSPAVPQFEAFRKACAICVLSVRVVYFYLSASTLGGAVCYELNVHLSTLRTCSWDRIDLGNRIEVHQTSMNQINMY